MNSMKHKNTCSQTVHVKWNNFLLFYQEEICLAFNKHFAAGHNLFKDLYIKIHYSFISINPILGLGAY